MIKQEYLDNIDQIHHALLEISQVSDWLAGLNAETSEISTGLSCILADMCGKADHALNVLNLLYDDLKAE